MKIDNRLKIVFLATILTLGLTACEKPGPAETAGKQLDQAAEGVSKSINNAVNDVDRAIKK